MTDSMIKRVTKAVMDAQTRNGKLSDFVHDDEAIAIARAAITAMHEPTDAMCEAWANAGPDDFGEGWLATLSDTDANNTAARSDWRAMIDAALSEGE